jgi:hypothetical protein
MKIKNKIFTLLGVFTLVGLTHSLTLKDLNAALTAPTSYDLNYQYNSSLTSFAFGGSSLGTQNSLRYIRTADGIYYNYSVTYTPDTVLGLSITQTFNRSNTSWTSFTIAGNTYYRPTDTKIGSDSTVGTLEKGTLIFDNQTNKNYLIHIDMSSNTSNVFTRLFYNDYRYNNGNDNTLTFFRTTMNRLYIPSFTKFELRHYSASSVYYLDAWYLQDLGVSDSYDAGYDAGYEQGDIDGYADGLNNNPNILLSGFQAMVGILVNFMLMIVNLEVFGVSILSVFSILALFVGIIWILKIIRG